MTKTARPHTATYDASMTGRPNAYYCRRCQRYVTHDHVEMTAQSAEQQQ